MIILFFDANIHIFSNMEEFFSSVGMRVGVRVGCAWGGGPGWA